MYQYSKPDVCMYVCVISSTPADHVYRTHYFLLFVLYLKMYLGAHFTHHLPYLNNLEIVSLVHVQKIINTNLTLTNNCKGFIDINIRHNTIKLLKENVRENLCDLQFDDESPETSMVHERKH